jgi:DNA ligase-1
VRDLKTGVKFEIGTGFDDATRHWFWAHRDTVKGELITYKHFKQTGVKNKPRQPVYVGLRALEDF